MLLERDSLAIGDTTQSPVTAWRDTPSPPRRALGPRIVAGDPRDPVSAGRSAASHSRYRSRRRRTGGRGKAAHLVNERLSMALGLLEALDLLLGRVDEERSPFWRVDRRVLQALEHPRRVELGEDPQ